MKRQLLSVALIASALYFESVTAATAISVDEFLKIKDQIENKYTCTPTNNSEAIEFVNAILGIERNSLLDDGQWLYPIAAKQKEDIVKRGLRKDGYPYVNERIICIKENEAIILNYNLTRAHYNQYATGWISALKFSYAKEAGHYKLIPVLNLNEHTYHYHTKLSSGNWHGDVHFRYLTSPK